MADRFKHVVLQGNKGLEDRSQYVTVTSLADEAKKPWTVHYDVFWAGPDVLVGIRKSDVSTAYVPLLFFWKEKA